MSTARKVVTLSTMNGGAGPRMWRKVSIASIALAIMLAIAAGTARAAATPRWIVFSATSPGKIPAQLFRIQSTGEGLQQLTTGSYSSLAPSFSADGKRIVFARTGVGILSMSLDGTGLRRLTTNGRDSYPTFSPDGKQVAFVRPFKDGWKVHVMSSSGAAERPLPKAPPSGRPSWTKDGLLIPSGGDLLKIDPTTGHVLKYYGALIDAIWGLNSVAVSPDRSTITYTGARASEPGDMECGEGPCQRFALYKESIVKKVKKPQRVVKDGGPATFSPDGKQLAFVSNGGLLLWSLAGNTSRAVSTGDAYPTISAPPTWQP
jgi:Tol biopolymer transport system component